LTARGGALRLVRTTNNTRHGHMLQVLSTEPSLASVGAVTDLICDVYV
jgi:hypothetical protein